LQLNTHLKLNKELNGEVIELQEGFAKIKLNTTEKMIADDQGLVHGGFAFCAADFAAMAAVNDPFVVLAKSETKFLAPIKVGQSVIFEGTITSNENNRAIVEVLGSVEEKAVFKGTFYTATLEKHVLA
jgi:acyl-coenzyme A thioesterase PaaI-like protein